MKIKGFIKQKDKQLHFAVCAGVACVSPMLAIGLATGKEYRDSKSPGNCWSWGDITADAVGVLLGWGINLLIF